MAQRPLFKLRCSMWYLTLFVRQSLYLILTPSETNDQPTSSVAAAPLKPSVIIVTANIHVTL